MAASQTRLGKSSKDTVQKFKLSHEDTIDEQEKKILRQNEDGDRHFTEDGGQAEITIDRVLQARANMAESKFNGREDSVVSEMTKQLPQETIHEIARCFQERFVGWRMFPAP